MSGVPRGMLFESLREAPPCGVAPTRDPAIVGFFVFHQRPREGDYKVRGPQGGCYSSPFVLTKTPLPKGVFAFIRLYIGSLDDRAFFVEGNLIQRDASGACYPGINNGMVCIVISLAAAILDWMKWELFFPFIFENLTSVHKMKSGC